jgi:hypothetical protein
MKGGLRLVVDNPEATVRGHLRGAALHQLADCLTMAVRSGDAVAVRAEVRRAELPPICIAAVATWMLRAGLDEAEILSVMG